jgi:hypothetical protein
MEERNNQHIQTRFEVLTAASMNMNVFWVVAACSSIGVYRLTQRPDDGGRKHL